MSDHSYLDWPFLNDDHRALAAEVDGWAEDHLVQLTQHEAVSYTHLTLPTTPYV